MGLRQRWSSLDRRLVSLALPALGALAVEPLYNLTDTAVVGHLGVAELGALAVASAILNLIQFGAGFLSTATASRVAYLRGQGEPERAAAAAAAAYLTALLGGVMVAVLVVLAARPLALLAGARGPVVPPTVTYLRLAGTGEPFLLLFLAGIGHLRGRADTMTPFVVTVVGTSANLALELVLVYGLGWGIAGSAVGTVAAQVLAAAVLLGLLRRRGSLPGLGLHPAGELRILWRSARVLLVRTAALVAVLSGSTLVAARMGTVVLGAHQIALQVWFLVALSLDALAVPAQVLVGEAIGAEDFDAAETTARRVVTRGVQASAFLAALTAATAPWVPRLFTSSLSIARPATTAILLVAASLPLTAVAFELDGVLFGASDYRYLRKSMWLAAVVFTPFATLALTVPGAGIATLWAGIASWLGARAALLALRWRSGRWKLAGS